MTPFWQIINDCASIGYGHNGEASVGLSACESCLRKALGVLLTTPKDVDGPKPESGNLGAYQQGWKNAFDFLREQVKETS